MSGDKTRKGGCDDEQFRDMSSKGRVLCALAMENQTAPQKGGSFQESSVRAASNTRRKQNFYVMKQKNSS